MADVVARRRWLSRTVAVGVVLALVVVVLGAYTRLQDAGLGCPDWPGCYGYLSVPGAAANVETAEARFPHAPFEAHKAWPEMVHRYFAGTLGLLIFAIAALGVRDRATAPLRLTLLLAGLVVLQAAFGMWTVTLKLWPQVVTTHLLGGFATLSLLWLLYLRLDPPPALPAVLRAHAVLALAAVIVQVMLGGWTTSNYAALACPDFPTCQGHWWPPMDAADGFDVFQDIGPNYLGGLLDNSARVAIHMGHRIGALVVFFVVGTLALRLRPISAGAALGNLLLVTLLTQVALGISNVVFTLPLPVATAHNGVGAVLLLEVIAVNYRSFRSGAPR
ncbi:MAG TPA: COX15/CtaA family protein [Pseudomonadales bacterium]|nr:COX15/CtaA family protein [Pseudomonadales bacterium]